jgi:hypothetical protein
MWTAIMSASPATKYLNQAGVKTEYIRLQDRGIRGNGHMVMIDMRRTISTLPAWSTNECKRT